MPPDYPGLFITQVGQASSLPDGKAGKMPAPLRVFVNNPGYYQQELATGKFSSAARPNTWMAVTRDMGVYNNVYPTNKREVGCWLAAGGRVVWQRAMQVPFYCSPALVGERTYVFDREGKGYYIIGAGRRFKLLATSELPDGALATPCAARSGRLAPSKK